MELGEYRHFKGGVYTVVAVAKHSETMEEIVVYTHDGEYWVRPKKMFTEMVEHQGKRIPRFEKIA